MLLDFNNKKGWGIKCDECKFRVSLLNNLFIDPNIGRRLKSES